MPTFAFECLNCGYKFTQLLPAGTKEALCLECGSTSKKLLTAPAVHFKGGGFYASSIKNQKEKETICSKCPKVKNCEKSSIKKADSH